MRAVGRRARTAFGRWARFGAVLLAVLIGIGALGPAPALGGDDHAGHAHRRLGVATYNLYLGADFAPLFTAANQQELVQRAGQGLRERRQDQIHIL
jgi:hypothetical protein